MTQPQLFSTAVDRPLTPRQQAALDAIAREPAGLTATALGAVVHTVPGPRSTFQVPTVTRCVLCPRRRHVGASGDGHRAFAAHRAEKHPPARRRR